MTVSPPAPPGRSLMERLGHPRGLGVLFFAEAWERFSFYGMRALLVLYLVKHLQMERADALEIYAIYTGLVYVTPFFGGMLADRVLGARKAVLIGGIVMAVGHLAMAFESLLYPALAFLMVGNGLFKPNISTLVGELYPQGDPRRDGGFTLFYMGINLGAFLSPLVSGTLGEEVGWHYGFGAAGVGMIIGLTVFWLGQGTLGKAGFPPDMKDATEASRLRPKDWRDVFVGAALALGLALLCLEVGQHLAPLMAQIPSGVKVGVGLALLGAAVWGMLDGGRREEGIAGVQRHVTLLVIFFFVIFFWMGFEQAGGTMNLFADQQTDRHLLGWEVPATWFQSVNSTFILLLAPLMSWLWVRLARGPWSPSTPQKMAAGMIVLGLGFVVMYVAQNQAVSRDVLGPDGSVTTMGQVGMGWLIAVYFFHTLGELCLSPIGLSIVTKLSVPRMTSLMMGVWFAATGAANYLAGILESLLHGSDVPLYGFLVLSSIGAGLVLLLLSPWLARWSHGRE